MSNITVSSWSTLPVLVVDNAVCHSQSASLNVTQIPALSPITFRESRRFAKSNLTLKRSQRAAHLITATSPIMVDKDTCIVLKSNPPIAACHPSSNDIFQHEGCTICARSTFDEDKSCPSLSESRIINGADWREYQSNYSSMVDTAPHKPIRKSFIIVNPLKNFGEIY